MYIKQTNVFLLPNPVARSVYLKRQTLSDGIIKVYKACHFCTKWEATLVFENFFITINEFLLEQ